MKKNIPLLYVGRRFEDGRLFDVFYKRGRSKDVARFRVKPRRFCVIGQWYEGKFEGKDLFISSTTPNEVKGAAQSEDLIKSWTRRDDADYMLSKRERDAAKGRRRVDTFKSSSYYSLADACRGLSYFETHDFISYLVNEIQKGKK